MPIIFPSASEVYYLRALLSELCPTSFDDLLVDQSNPHQQHKTYQVQHAIVALLTTLVQEAARAMGLFQDNNELEQTFMLAITLCFSAKRLRCLFIQTIIEGGNTVALMEHCNNWASTTSTAHPLAEDFPAATRHNDMLVDLQSRLDMYNKTLDQYGLEMPLPMETMGQRHWASQNMVHSSSCHTEFCYSHNTPLEQKQCFAEVEAHMEHYRAQKSSNGVLTSHYITIQGRSGRGKTEVAKALFHWCTCNGLVAVCVAPTGLASLKYGMNGDTAHHMFELPVDEDCHGNMQMVSKCQMTGQRADFLRSVDVVLWDEHANQDRQCIEAVHELFCNLAGLNTQQALVLPFAGKVVVGLMDFRQIAPVVPRASKSKIIDSSVCKSRLWQQRAAALVLLQSMRDKSDPQYAEFVLRFGNDQHAKWKLRCKSYLITGEGIQECKSCMPDMVELPVAETIQNVYKGGSQLQEKLKLNMVDSLQGALDFVYGDGALKQDLLGMQQQQLLAAATDMCAKAILTIRNDKAASINAEALAMLCGKQHDLRAANSLADSNGFSSAHLLYTEEYMAMIGPKRVPPHLLQMKAGAKVMFMSNMSRKEAMMNGSQGIVLAIHSNFLITVLLVPSGEVVSVRRRSYHWWNDGVRMKRVQFPLKLSYAMTINKSQGQTLRRVVVDLEHQPFTHGQAYVAIGRVCDRHSIAFWGHSTCIGAKGQLFMRNVCFADFLNMCHDEEAEGASKLECYASSMPQRYADCKEPPKPSAESTTDAQRKCPPTATTHADETTIGQTSSDNGGPSTINVHTHWTWGDGHCFYYAVAQKIGMLGHLQVKLLEELVADTHRRAYNQHSCPVAIQACKQATNAKKYVPTASLCSCASCNAVAQHRQAAQQLRMQLQTTMQTLIDYYYVLEDGGMPMAELQTRIDGTTTEVATRLQGWAGDAEMRAMAVHLQQDLYVCMPDAVRLYEHSVPPLQDAAQSIHMVGFLAASNGEGPHGWYFKKYSHAALALQLQMGQSPLAIYFNGYNHFEYATLAL
jgi:hypothetical protein